ncbi:major facilitator superfamily domain-containing protein [Penicillium angulare]|uniref:major facilitator superfamily domain-containing protein n=1 Tax=Penicillium angulare TaxID=116970 RepID=UPI002540EE1D|nr:major facilitator superfamily domain-containing protein [Penicillium angulare]KAJ5273751.1 major facilitator superfamily domain-containing protein [Penicillium angulare]
MSLVVTGTVGGPVIAGALLELTGYWPAWCLPLGFLAFDIIAWLILIEPQDFNSADTPARDGTPEYDETTPDSNNRECSPLLSPITQPNSKDGEVEQTPSATKFYFTMLADIRVIVGISNSVTTSVVVAALNTTLPVHLREIFGWGPLDVGTMFLLLRVPSIILGPISGWLRDIVGLRYPTTIAWMVMTPMLIFLGIPGNGTSWASGEENGKQIFIFCMVGMGLVLPFIQGSGMLHVMSILEEYESKQRKIFGPRGGRSRVFAMNEVAFNLGLMLGPLFAGPLSEMIGFDRMSMILGCICFVVGLASYRFFRTRNEVKDGGASV